MSTISGKCIINHRTKLFVLQFIAVMEKNTFPSFPCKNCHNLRLKWESSHYTFFYFTK